MTGWDWWGMRGEVGAGVGLVEVRDEAGEGGTGRE